MANYKYLDLRLVIDAATRENIIRQYRERKITQEYCDRVELVEFGVEVPAKTQKIPTPPLKVLYAGRGTAQKRIWLLNRIAEHFLAGDRPVEFIFAGSMADELSPLVRQRCSVHGEIGDKEQMNRLFAEAHVIILTSSFEGFPVSLKEGMAFGCVPVATALPGNILHLKHMNNALLIDQVDNEDEVVKQAIDYIALLAENSELLRSLSANAYDYALQHFGKEKFMEFYRQLLASDRPQWS